MVLHAGEAVRLQARIEKGERWLRAHADDTSAHIHLLNLRDRLNLELLAVRCYERVCWTRCNETWGYIVNAGQEGFAIQISLFGGTLHGNDPVRALWDGLLRSRSPPSRGSSDQWTCEPIHPGAAVWELPSLRELLARKREGVVT